MNNVRLKYLVSERITTGASESANEYSSNETRYIRISDFDEKGNIREDAKVSIKNEKAANYLLEENDVLIAVTGGTVGKSMIFNLSEKAAYAGYLARIRTNEKLNYKYLWYYLNSPLFQKWRKEAINVSTIENISAGKYADLPIVYHEINYQETIVKDLNTKFSMLDKLIINQQQQIEKLKEYKQSLISEVVTKGLDPKVEFRDSGVEWIGKIPKHWDLFRVKDLSTNTTLRNSNPNLQYIALENIESQSYRFIDTDNEYDPNEGILAPRYSVLFGKLRPYLAKSFYCENDVSCSSEFAVFPLENEVTSKYFLLLTQSFGFIDTINMSTYGTKMPRANINFINNLSVQLPPYDEQKLIVDFLLNRISIIEKILSIKDIKIKELEDYKKSLIYEYVTGKKEVS